MFAGCSTDTTEPEGSASPLRARLMTGQQYSNTIAQIFGEDISNSVVAPLPPLSRTDGLLASGAAFVGVTSDQIQQIQQAAQSVAAKVVDEQHRDFLIFCFATRCTRPRWTNWLASPERRPIRPKISMQAWGWRSRQC
jgi:hypothetical protein